MLVEFATDESITATGFRASYNRGMNTPLQSLENSINGICIENLKMLNMCSRVGFFYVILYTSIAMANAGS